MRDSSWWGIGRLGNCPGGEWSNSGELSRMRIRPVGNWPVGDLSWWGLVLLASCPIGELSWWGVVLVGICPGGELSRVGICSGRGLA